MLETVIQIKSERAINLSLVITCDETIGEAKAILTKPVPTKTVPTNSDPVNFNEKNVTC